MDTCHPLLTDGPAFLRSQACQRLVNVTCPGCAWTSSTRRVSQSGRNIYCCLSLCSPQPGLPSGPWHCELVRGWGSASLAFQAFSCRVVSGRLISPSLSPASPALCHAESSRGLQSTVGPSPWLPVLTCMSPCWYIYSLNFGGNFQEVEK